MRKREIRATTEDDTRTSRRGTDRQHASLPQKTASIRTRTFALEDKRPPQVTERISAEDSLSSSDDLVLARKLYIDLLADLRVKGILRDFDGSLITEKRLAYEMGVDPSVLLNFKLGIDQNPSIATILKCIKRYANREDPRIKELQEIAKKRGELIDEPRSKEIESGEVNRVFRFVPYDIKEAGKLLREARILHGVDIAALVKNLREDSLFVNDSYIQSFENGVNLSPDLARIIKAAEARIGFDDEMIKNMREILRQREQELLWMRTLTHFEVPTFGKSVQYLRISRGLTLRGFAENPNLSERSLNNYEKDKSTPHPEAMEAILTQGKLDLNRKPAQFMRLQAEKTEREPMTLKDLQQCRLSRLVKYFRILRGCTQKQFGTQIGYKQSDVEDYISDIERDHRSIDEQTLEEFIVWLGLSADSVLAEVIRKKHRIPNTIIPMDELEQVLGERYLFKENFEEIMPYSISEKDATILAQLEAIPSIGKKFKHLRTEKGFKTVWQLPTTKDVMLIAHKVEKEDPNRFVLDYALTKLLNRTFGYDIHHPMMWIFLDQLRFERAEKVKTRL